jgi:hypothetical protein
MNCSRAREVFPELLDRRTPATAHLPERTHLAACPECQRDYASLAQVDGLLDAPPTLAPSPRLRQTFYALLEEEKNSAASARAVATREHHRRTARLWRWILSPLAACALLALGFLAGTRFQPSPAATPASVADTQRKLAELQRQVDSMGQLVGYSLLQQQQRPTTDRLRGVLASAADTQPSQRVLNELISALALDPSAHVRLRALDALFPHLEQEVVRAGVLACLTREENPLVQVSMIDFLATARDATARPAIESLSHNHNADRSVREAARRALAQL